MLILVLLRMENRVWQIIWERNSRLFIHRLMRLETDWWIFWILDLALWPDDIQMCLFIYRSLQSVIYHIVCVYIPISYSMRACVRACPSCQNCVARVWGYRTFNVRMVSVMFVASARGLSGGVNAELALSESPSDEGSG